MQLLGSYVLINGVARNVCALNLHCFDKASTFTHFPVYRHKMGILRETVGIAYQAAELQKHFLPKFTSTIAQIIFMEAPINLRHFQSKDTYIILHLLAHFDGKG